MEGNVKQRTNNPASGRACVRRRKAIAVKDINLFPPDLRIGQYPGDKQ